MKTLINIFLLLIFYSCNNQFNNYDSSANKSEQIDLKKAQIDSAQKVIDFEEQNTFTVDELYNERGEVENLYYKNLSEYSRKSSEWNAKWKNKVFWLTGTVYFDFNRYTDVYTKTLIIEDSHLSSYFKHLVFKNCENVKDGDLVKLKCNGLRFYDRRLYPNDFEIEINPLSKQILLDSFKTSVNYNNFNEFYNNYITSYQNELKLKEEKAKLIMPKKDSLLSVIKDLIGLGEITLIKSGDFKLINDTLIIDVNYTQSFGDEIDRKEYTAIGKILYLFDNNWKPYTIEVKSEICKYYSIIYPNSKKSDFNIQVQNATERLEFTTNCNILYKDGYFDDWKELNKGEKANVRSETYLEIMNNTNLQATITMQTIKK